MGRKAYQVGFLELVSNIKGQELVQAKFPKPVGILADFQTLKIKKNTEMLVMIKDNTIVRQREKAIVENQVQTVFFASVAHDLRTPLNSLLASNLNLLSKFDNIPMHLGHQRTRQSLLIQKSSIQFLINIVEDIMDMSKFEFGQFQLSFSWFSFNEIVDEIFEISEFLALQKKIDLIKEIEIETNIMLYSDKKRLKQVLLNLVTNALKFTHHGYVKVRAYFVNPIALQKNKMIDFDNSDEDNSNSLFECQDDENLHSDKFSSRQSDINLYTASVLKEINHKSILINEEQQLVVEVIDTGIGIKAHDQNNLFKIFGKVKTSDSINQQGVGLGLNICKKICEFLGGQITITSQEEKGSTFTFQVNVEKVKVTSQPPKDQNLFNQCSVFLDGLNKYKTGDMRHNPFKDQPYYRSATENALQYKLSPMQQQLHYLTTEQQKMFELAQEEDKLIDMPDPIQLHIQRQMPQHHLNNQNNNGNQYMMNSTTNMSTPQSASYMNYYGGAQYYKSLGTSCQDADCKRILVVDDNHFNIIAMNLMLEEAFKIMKIEKAPEIDSAVDGLDGLEKMALKSKINCCNMPYKLVLIDLNMPNMGGLQMMKNIRAKLDDGGLMSKYKDTIFVLCTAQNENNTYPYKEAGFDYFLEKPIDLKVLESILRKCYK
eukprot:403335252